MQGEKMPGMLTAVRGGRDEEEEEEENSLGRRRQLSSYHISPCRRFSARLSSLPTTRSDLREALVGAVEHPTPLPASPRQQTINFHFISQSVSIARHSESPVLPLSFETTKRGGNVRTGAVGVGDMT